MSFLCSLPVIGVLIAACLPPSPLATGYVEGTYIKVAPIETARIIDVPVQRGDHVVPDQIVARLEKQDAAIAVDNAKAALSQAKSTLANLEQGARPEKIAALQASLKAAELSARQAERDMTRQRTLLEKGSVAQSVYDTARTAYDVAKAQAEEIRSNLAYTSLPARENEIAAAKAAVEQAEAALKSAQWKEEQRTLMASVTGVVTDIIHEAGEMAGPQVPILEILPDDGIKLKLYIPEESLASIQMGSKLTITCDSCGDDLSATVSYISDGPEFTPPVIYSLENRQKLVYLIEAKASEGSKLNPGQIVSAWLTDAGSGGSR
ncbi:HlyD family secretion protein [Cohaesibacter marisflavi]|uniref:HlyD family secretion protein n=1 Tax=Cohaesibacter marisflavi TaxID=655353 RepID=A0A1I5H7P2_9HYPH|nr:HlyD family efflux transporter periplasmic adaptor subunit [Cohaesibacter marisflavi]SFO44213.1 HlyD family secretion protein [Cohaesibacter marisflavi]